MKKSKIIFTKKAATFILEALDHGVDSQGFIFNKNTKMKVKDIVHGENIHIDEFAGVSKQGFYKGDLSSIIHLAEENKNV